MLSKTSESESAAKIKHCCKEHGLILRKNNMGDFLETLMQEGKSGTIGEIVESIAGPGCSFFLSAVFIIFDKNHDAKYSGVIDWLRHVGTLLFISSVIRYVTIILVIWIGLTPATILWISITISAIVKILMKGKFG